MAETQTAILVVDDEPMVTEIVEMLVRAETNWDVAAFQDPQRAVESLGTRTYDAALTDFLMPGMDGLELLKKVREAQPACTRVLLTGYADKQNAIRAINEAGLYYYLEKPWDNHVLLMVLRNAVERARLVRDLDEHMRRLTDRDKSLVELRSRLLKAIL